jgi:hypothetical protein
MKQRTRRHILPTRSSHRTFDMAATLVRLAFPACEVKSQVMDLGYQLAIGIKAPNGDRFGFRCRAGDGYTVKTADLGKCTNRLRGLIAAE